MKNNQYCLITGASEGFGKALALECASRNMNLVLVSLPGPELHHLGDFIKRNFDINVVIIEKDLSIEENCHAVFQQVNALELSVNMLINNAGLGGTLLFGEGNLSFFQKQVRLNVMATTMLTRLFLEMLKKNGPASILNVGSLCSFFYLPKKGVYGATKSFLYFFSKSLRMELENDNINVSIICPGAMNTNISVTLLAKTSSWLSRLAVMNPEDVATIAINGLLKGKEVIIPGRINNLFMILDKFLPSFVKKMIVNKQMSNLKSVTALEQAKQFSFHTENQNSKIIKMPALKIIRLFRPAMGYHRYRINNIRNISVLLILLLSFIFLSLKVQSQPYLNIVNLKYSNSPNAGLMNQNKNPVTLQYASAETNLPLQFNNKRDAVIFSPFVEKWSSMVNKHNWPNHYSIALPVSLSKTIPHTHWSFLLTGIVRMNDSSISSTGKWQAGGAFLLNYKKTEKLTWKFGLYINNELFGVFVMPLAGLDWKINERNNLFGVLPGNLTYEHRINHSFYYGANFRAITNSYGNGNGYWRMDENQLGVYLDTYLTPKLVLNAEVGHSLFRKIRTGIKSSTPLNLNVNDNYYFKLALAYRIRFRK